MIYNLDGQYPVMANWLRIKSLSNGEFYVKNVATEKEFQLDEDEVYFLTRLTGNRDPFEVEGYSRSEVRQLLEFLDSNSLIRTEGRTFLSDWGVKMYTIFVPERHRTRSMLPALCNGLLMLSWLPVLLFGIQRFVTRIASVETDYMIVGTILFLAVSMVLHEAAHAMACLAYGGSLFEAGIMWQYVYPGAYVLVDTENITSRWKRIQINAAGVEMNFLLTGVFLSLASYGGMLSGIWMIAGINNFLLAIVNLSFINGMDGCTILAELFGTDNLVDRAKEMIRYPYFRKPVLKKGINGKAMIVTGAILLFFQLLLPSLIITNILCMIGGV